MFESTKTRTVYGIILDPLIPKSQSNLAKLEINLQ